MTPQKWPLWFVGFDVAALSVPAGALIREVVGRMVANPGNPGWLAAWYSVPLFTMLVVAGGAAFAKRRRRSLGAYLAGAILPLSWWLAVVVTISR